jgi:hypothetical protein
VEFEENCGLKRSLIPNHYWPCLQLCGHERPLPKVISRGGLLEKEIMLNTLRFRRRVKGKVVVLSDLHQGTERAYV